MMMKNNPLKMFGSYVGFVVGVVGAYFSFAIVFYFAGIGEFNFFVLFIPLVPVVVGFLLGWGVHVLIRKSANI